jgi:Predicted membrane protein
LDILSIPDCVIIQNHKVSCSANGGKRNENFSAYGDTDTRKERRLWLLSTETEDRMNQKIRKLTLCALFAALSYVVFTFLQIKIPIGTDATSVHLGNAVVVIGALILGGPLGGISGAIGMAIGDFLDPVYVIYVPETLLCKTIIGLVVGLVAHRIGKIQELHDRKKIFFWVLLASAAGLFANVIMDPTIGYVYKVLLLGKSAAKAAFNFSLFATAFNAVTSTIVATAVYMGLYRVLRREQLSLG